MMEEKQEKTCFVIAPIGREGSDTRIRSDKIMKFTIEPSVRPLGYRVIRADQISESGLITDQIIIKLIQAELVIADLTDNNPNVYYELAIRHAAKLPIIHLIRKGNEPPFDLRNNRAIPIAHDDIEVHEAAKKEIIEQISKITEGLTTETPISAALSYLEIEVLRQSDDPEQKNIAEVISMITGLRSDMLTIRKAIEKVDQKPQPFDYSRVFEQPDPNRMEAITNIDEDKTNTAWKALTSYDPDKGKRNQGKR